MSFKKLKVTRIIGGALGLLLALNLVLVPAPALAVQGIPHWFNGTVTIGTESAPEGIIISAQIDGIVYASAQVDAAGRYGDDPLFYVPADDPDTSEVKEGGVAGEMVEFYISDTLAGQYVFENFGVTVLNLTVVETDVIPPTVSSTTPVADAPSVAVDVVVSATFSEDIQEGDNFADIAISGATGVSASIDGAILTIAHNAFDYETSYTVTIPAGAVKDSADLPLAEAEVWSFTVATEEEAADFDPAIYDTDGTPGISYDEAMNAINDYADGTGSISKAEVLEVIKLYFA